MRRRRWRAPGVGRLVLVDGDTVADTNRNRQLIALTSTVRAPKAEVMASRVAGHQPQAARRSRMCSITAPARAKG